MALRKCRECGSQVSSRAAACPQCGAPTKRKTNPLVGLLAFIIIIIVCAGVCTEVFNLGDKTLPSVGDKQGDASKRPTGQAAVEEPAPQPAAKAEPEKGMGETLSVGYTSYCVWRAWYSDRLSSNQFLNKRPNAKWLFLDISVRNNDRKARMVPPFKLVDENGAEYESSGEGTMIENAIGVLESLNPSVTKQGLVVFDVPQNHQYRLKVSGGYWSSEDGFIRIVPGSPP